MCSNIIPTHDPIQKKNGIYLHFPQKISGYNILQHITKEHWEKKNERWKQGTIKKDLFHIINSMIVIFLFLSFFLFSSVLKPDTKGWGFLLERFYRTLYTVTREDFSQKERI